MTQMRLWPFSVVCLAITAPAFAQCPPTDVFISEYVEGSSNNKAIEIFNGTGASVNLASYAIRIYFNGNTTPGTPIPLAGVVADSDVYVVANPSAAGPILLVADQTASGLLFNGNDAVELVNGATTIDVIGQIGFDPGLQWGTGLTSTADNTLRRKVSVCAGDPNGSDAFDPIVEWDGFPLDDFSGLGFHNGVPVELMSLSVE